MTISYWIGIQYPDNSFYPFDNINFIEYNSETRKKKYISASVFSAAPEMLKTLIQIHDEMMVAFCSDTPRTPSWFESRIKTVKNAIAKSTGEKS